MRTDDNYKSKEVHQEEGTVQGVYEACQTSLLCRTGRGSTFIEHGRRAAILFTSNRKAEVSACRLLR